MKNLILILSFSLLAVSVVESRTNYQIPLHWGGPATPRPTTPAEIERYAYEKAIVDNQYNKQHPGCYENCKKFVAIGPRDSLYAPILSGILCGKRNVDCCISKLDHNQPKGYQKLSRCTGGFSEDCPP